MPSNDDAVDGKEGQEGGDGGASPSLPALFAALARGVRATNDLPLSKKKEKSAAANDGSSSSSEEDDAVDDDEYAYQIAFPEYRSLSAEAKRGLVRTLASSLRSSGGDDDDGAAAEDVNVDADADPDDPLLWERCGDATDALLDRIERHVLFMRGGTSAAGGANQDQDGDLLPGQMRRMPRKRKGGLREIVSGMADIEKSQITYDFAKDVDNDRTTPFVPPIPPNTRKPHGMTPSGESKSEVLFDLRPLPGHGLPNGGGNNATAKSSDDDLIAPDVHYPHQYQKELEALEFRPWQFRPPPPLKSWGVPGDGGGNGDEDSVDGLPPRGIGGTLRPTESADGTGEGPRGSPGTAASADHTAPDATDGLDGYQWIDTEDDLREYAAALEAANVREIAVDLEAHSYRSFAGFVCLMQLSVRWPASGVGGAGAGAGRARDVLVDTLALRHCVGRYLRPIFADPDVVKIMHGAEGDVTWLQRDFGIYVVNLFDTHKAARQLHYPSLGLSYLLSTIAGVDVDKRHQLSDWRVRPLPRDMLSYAVSDTHYLLDVYDFLRAELVRACGHDSSSVVDAPDGDDDGGGGGGDDDGVNGARRKDDAAVSKPPSIRRILEESRGVCLLRYAKEPFRPRGWERLLKKKGASGGGRGRGRGRGRGQRTSGSEWDDGPRRRCLESLWDWRDDAARTSDESLQFVCPNHGLVRIASRLPTTSAALRSALNPLPELVADNSDRIFDIVREARGAYDGKGVVSSPPQRTGKRGPVDKETGRCGGGGTEGRGGRGRNASPRHHGDRVVQSPSDSNQKTTALPTQGAFQCPISFQEVEFSSDGSSSSDGEIGRTTTTAAERSQRRRKRCLMVTNPFNPDYRADVYSSHSLEMGGSSLDDGPPGRRQRRRRRGVTVDGLGAARLTMMAGERARAEKDHRGDDGKRRGGDDVACMEAEAAAKVAAGIRSKLGKRGNMLDLVSSTVVRLVESPSGDGGFDEPNDADAVVGGSSPKEQQQDQAEEEEDDIPMSIREAYGKGGRRYGENVMMNKKGSSETVGDKSSSATPSAAPFDYSRTASIGALGGGPPPSNPFFSGAAAATRGADKSGGKRKGGKGAETGKEGGKSKKKQLTERPGRDNGRSFVYRSSGK